jgi:hypothetical protein
MNLSELTYRKLSLTQQISLFLILSIILYLISPFFAYPRADAATLGATYVRLDRMAASTATTGLVCATTPAGDTGTEGKVAVTFPTGFTVSGTATNWAVATTNIPNGTTAWPSIAQPSADGQISGQTVKFVSGDLSTSTTYCFRWTNTAALTTSTAGNSKTGTVTTQTSGDADLDTDTYAVSVQDDQIGVSAAVSQTFTFSTGSDITFTTSPLTVTTVNYGSSTANVSTNGANGYIAWVRSANGNLTSSATSATITTPGSIDNAVSDLSGGTYGYVLDVILTTDGSGTGTLSQAANFGQEYDGGNTCSSATDGGTLTTSLEPIAASNGTTDGDVLTLCTLVRINGAQTAASDYADTLTVVAAGRF